MSMGKIYLPILMYHGIRKHYNDQLPSGWSWRHAVDAASFAAQLDVIATVDRPVVRLTDLDQSEIRSGCPVITFDDGHVSDYLIAAPALKQRALPATFFITWAFLGRPGYVTRQQVRELRAQAFDIGSHGLTHKKLTEVGPVELWREALDSKRRLEDLLGDEIISFAIPSGAYNDQVLQALWAAGYGRIMTSDFGYARRDHSVMHRLGVMAETTPRQFRAFVSGGPWWAARQHLLEGVKERLNRVLLGGATTPPSPASIG
ncbi:MAG: polysaccharide deacetylase family protein [Candidatus Binataceae bacterium]